MSIKSLKLFAALLFAVITIGLTSCSKDNELSANEEIEAITTETEAFVDESLFRIQESGNMGRFGCYELVFPITIDFADSSSATVNSYEELIEAIRSYKEANPDATEKPALSYPIEVINEDGELIAINNREELRELRRACPKNFFGTKGHRGHRKRACACFRLVYPLTLQFPDGSTADATDRAELKSLVRTWKAENPDATERPELVFPIDVLMEDGTTMSVDSKEALRELKQSCSEEEE
ncbi:MAG: hypothetical protein AAGG75_05320 [Bacteroidota bacterium]